MYRHIVRSTFLLLILITFFSLDTLAQASWAPIGQDIEGVADYDYTNASSFSWDARTLAVGAYANDGTGPNAGHVRVFRWNGSAWMQKGIDIDAEAANDGFGSTVQLDSTGDVLAVGATFNSGAAPHAGHVRVFDWNGTAWIQRGMDLDGPGPNSDFGRGLSLSNDGNIMAIGAYLNGDSGAFSGQARVYEWSGTAWQQMGATFYGDSIYSYLGHGCSLSASGSRLAISAYGAPVNGAITGICRVYDWSGTAWLQVGSDLVGEAPGDAFGTGVSLNASGQRLIVGGSGNDAAGADAGFARVFDWNGTAWVQVGADIDGEAAADRSGEVVSISANGQRVVIGAPHNTGNGMRAGHARMFEWSGTNWIQVGADIDGTAAWDNCGSAVEISSSGDYVAITSFSYSGANQESGQVRVFGTKCMADTSVTVNSPSLVANAQGVSYQWLDCNNGHAVIPGANLATFTATTNGSYAVVVSDSSCTDTSDCYTINAVAAEPNVWEDLSAFPVPSRGELQVKVPSGISSGHIRIRDLRGKELALYHFEGQHLLRVSMPDAAGTYILEVDAGVEGVRRLKVIRE